MGVFFPTWFKNLALQRLNNRTRFVKPYSNILGDVVSHNAFTVCASALGVDNTLGDALTSKMSEFVNQVEVGEHDGTLGASSHGVLIVVHRTAVRSSNGLH